MALVTLLAAPALGTAHEPEELAALQDCAVIVPVDDRVVCYDRVVERISGIDVPEPKEQNPNTAELDSAPRHSPEADFGRERLPGNSKKKGRPQSIDGAVVSCVRSPTGKYVFELDNGQIWRQTDSQRLRWSNCSFAVTVEKIGAGYRLRKTGASHYVRVTRLR